MKITTYQRHCSKISKQPMYKLIPIHTNNSTENKQKICVIFGKFPI